MVDYSDCSQRTFLQHFLQTDQTTNFDIASNFYLRLGSSFLQSSGLQSKPAPPALTAESTMATDHHTGTSPIIATLLPCSSFFFISRLLISDKFDCLLGSVAFPARFVSTNQRFLLTSKER